MSKRAAVVRDYILAHGAINTGQLADMGYGHPPRAVRDLRDAGAGVQTVMITGPDGRRQASYVFSGVANEDAAGRVNIPKAFADALKARTEHRCAVCAGVFPDRLLQADHRIPFAIAGDSAELLEADFMPLCAPDNRSKSWSCEHCPNWSVKDVSVCASCFWAHPEGYSHVETRPERRLSIIFQGPDTTIYDGLQREARQRSVEVSDFARQRLAE